MVVAKGLESAKDLWGSEGSGSSLTHQHGILFTHPRPCTPSFLPFPSVLPSPSHLSSPLCLAVCKVRPGFTGAEECADLSCMWWRPGNRTHEEREWEQGCELWTLGLDSAPCTGPDLPLLLHSCGQ